MIPSASPCLPRTHRRTLRRERIAAGATTGRRASPRPPRCTPAAAMTAAPIPQSTAGTPAGKEQRRMSVTPNDYVAAPNDVVAAAREFIRGEGDACVVSIYRLLHELSDKFGDRFPV